MKKFGRTPVGSPTFCPTRKLQALKRKKGGLADAAFGGAGGDLEVEKTKNQNTHTKKTTPKHHACVFVPTGAQKLRIPTWKNVPSSGSAQLTPPCAKNPIVVIASFIPPPTPPPPIDLSSHPSLGSSSHYYLRNNSISHYHNYNSFITESILY